MKTKKQILGNFLLFYFSWWLIIMLMAQRYLWAPSVIFVIALFIQLKFISNNLKVDVKEMAIISALLIAFDTILFLFNLIFFHYSLLYYLPPAWLIFISILFSSTFSYGFSSIRNKWILQIILGGVLAPITYLTARRYTLIDINEPFSLYYVIHVVGWMLIIPGCFSISKKLKGN